MIDNDMPPPKNLFDCVTKAPADASVVVPQMQMWDESKPSVTLCWGMDEAKVPRTGKEQRLTIEGDTWYELTKCGTGIIFIRPKVFETIEKPYFWYPLNEDQGIEGTEDVTFTQKVTGIRCAKCGGMKAEHTQFHEFVDAGLKIYGYSGCIAGHYHNVNLSVLAHYMYAEKEKQVSEPAVSLPVPSESAVSLPAPVAAECPSR
jgi:hypothetical protein